jgi:vacuolar protein sorting-associated protein 26
MNFFSSLFSKPNVEILLNEIPKRRCVYLRDENHNRIKFPSFYDRENIEGKIILSINNNSFSHNGIKVQIVGLIENKLDKKIYEFISLSKDICPASKLNNQINTFEYTFNNVEKIYESYRGINLNIKYLIRVIIEAKIRSLIWEREFGVVNPVKKEALEILNDPIEMSVGISEWLHLIFYLDRSKYTTKDVITGRILFKKVTLNLKMMALEIIKKESYNNGELSSNKTICRFEIMDGAPVKNEIIPIRFFLSPYELTPTYKNINNKFSVRYFINLVIYDSKDKRYFKQHEIILYRIPRIT